MLEELEDEQTPMTQRITLEGHSAEQYHSSVEAGFAPNICPGMEEIAHDMARHPEGGT